MIDIYFEDLTDEMRQILINEAPSFVETVTNAHAPILTVYTENEEE